MNQLFGPMISDERLVNILSYEGPFSQVFIDAPLSLPPCVACQRPTCPSIDYCEEPAVAYMYSLSKRLKDDKKPRQKIRPMNPQIHRFWDAWYTYTHQGKRFEPTFSSNHAAVAIRALTLQKRLRHLTPPLELKETAIAALLPSLGQKFSQNSADFLAFRSFEKGLRVRKKLLDLLLLTDLISLTPEHKNDITHSVDLFSALLTVVVAIWHEQGITAGPPKQYLPKEHWVYLPKIL